MGRHTWGNAGSMGSSEVSMGVVQYGVVQYGVVQYGETYVGQYAGSMGSSS